MREAKREFEKRKSEVEDFFIYLNKIQNPSVSVRKENPEIVGSNITAIMKSSGILLLYNLVESTVSNLLVAIHETFSDEGLTYDKLSDNIQSIWFNYYYQNIKNGSIKDDDVMLKMKIIHDTWSKTKPIELTFEQYTKYKSGAIFSGNLDAREIRKIFKKYGINLFDKQSLELKFIKESRNKLAHGELSFLECGKDMVPSYFNKLKEETIEFLELLIKSVDQYIINGEYRKDV